MKNKDRIVIICEPKKKAMGVFLFFFRFASDSLCMVGLWREGRGSVRFPFTWRFRLEKGGKGTMNNEGLYSGFYGCIYNIMV